MNIAHGPCFSLKHFCQFRLSKSTAPKPATITLLADFIAVFHYLWVELYQNPWLFIFVVTTWLVFFFVSSLFDISLSITCLAPWFILAKEKTKAPNQNDSIAQAYPCHFLYVFRLVTYRHTVFSDHVTVSLSFDAIAVIQQRQSCILARISAPS